MHAYTYAFAATLALVAACEREPQPPASAPAPASSSSAASGSTTTTTPANVGQPDSQAERREGANPVQGQVDPKQRTQHEDFQQRGDDKGPTSPETQPKPGG